MGRPTQVNRDAWALGDPGKLVGDGVHCAVPRSRHHTRRPPRSLQAPTGQGPGGSPWSPTCWRSAAALCLCLLAPAPGHRADDCNRNGTDDRTDIATGTSEDCNGDFAPDECETAPFSLRLGGDEVSPVENPQAAVIADVNGDGLADLVTGNRVTSSNIAVHLGSGTQTFSPPQEFPAGERLSAMVAADLDRDGDIDLATANRTSLRVLLNSGDGAFATGGELDGVADARALAAGDLTGDGLPELVAADRAQDALVVFRNRRGGAFDAPIQLAVGRVPAAAAVADLDGDGDLDLAASNRGSNSVSLLRNEGGGAFLPAENHDLPAQTPFSLSTADIDGDGDPDLVAAVSTGIVTLVNDGRAGFRSAAMPAGTTHSFAAGDLNGDGRVDFLLGSLDSNTLTALVNGGGRFVPVSLGIFLPSVPRAIFTGDLEGDGDLDALAIDIDSRLHALWNLGQTSPPSLEFGATSYRMTAEPHSAAMGDVNGDASLDVVTANGTFASFSVFLGNGDGTFVERPDVAVAGAEHLNSICTGDFDGDRSLDFAMADSQADKLRVFLNAGDATFTDAAEHPTGSRPFQVTSGDLDGDGLVDLASANQESNDITVLFNQGAGAFGARRSLAAGNRPLAIATGDFDASGIADLAVANMNSSSVTVFLTSAGRAFAPGVEIPVEQAPVHVVAGDFDGDRDLDLATANQGTSDVAILRNDGRGSFLESARFALGQQPYSLAVADIDGDGFLDLAGAIQRGANLAGMVSLLLGDGDGGFQVPLEVPLGGAPRFVLPGDLDLDGDTDLTVANHGSSEVTVLRNETAPPFARDYLESICTWRDFHDVSIRAGGASNVERLAKYILPAAAGPDLLPTLFQNASRFRLHQDFLQGVFPERFPGLTVEEYNRLTGRRATRRYFAGVIRRFRAADRTAYGFSVLVDTSIPAERLTLEEVRGVHETLRRSFRLEPLGYFPEGREARDDAAGWGAPGFPVYLEDAAASTAYEAYTRGVGYGRVRLLDADGLAAAGAAGEISFQSILVLEQAPRDIEGVFGGVVTGEPQGELSHLAIRAARRGTPNAYLEGARAAFAPWDGMLVRLEVLETEVLVEEAAVEEARAWWDANRPRLSTEPEVDPEFSALSSLAEMDLAAGPLSPEARFGGKAANLARLHQLLAGGPFARYREEGFAIPVRYFIEFLRSNAIPSAVDPRRLVTYEEHLSELARSPAFQSDSAARAVALARFREHAREEGRLDPDFLARLVERIGEVFPPGAMLRFRSSSNVEDALEFNGAGLYESLSGCAADDFDADREGPSLCDPRVAEERGLARALKRVWASLYTFRAYEERAFYGIPEERVAMAILVTRAFPDERANGVAFTGNIANPLDRRYVVTAQVGEASVVSPEPGVVAEKDVLEVAGGRVARILRPEAGSSLLPPGSWVLSDGELQELGAVMSHVDAGFPIELGGRSRREVLLDMEFKLAADATLAIKQVRPFLLSAPPPPAPTFALEVSAGAACGVFGLAGAERGPREEYELKSTVRFRAGSVALPTAADAFTGDLVEEVLLGPERAAARPRAPGLFRLRRVPGPGTVTLYRFSFEQDFDLPDGGSLRLETAVPLVFRGEGEEALEGPRALDAGWLDRQPGGENLQARPGGGPLVRYGPCNHDHLPAWEIEAELEDGSRLYLLERHLPVAPGDGLGTGPASLEYAEVSLRGGPPRAVTDYWHLVYSAFRHNRRPSYWVVLEPPAVVPGLEGPVRAVEIVSPEERTAVPARASYLAESFEVLAAPRVLAFARIEAGTQGAGRFRRGDANADGALNLADALAALNYLFLAGAPPACEKSADANDSGGLDLADGLHLLNYLYLDGPPPPEPFLFCGVDPTADRLGCRRHAPCAR